MTIGFIGQRYSSQIPNELHGRLVGFFLDTLEKKADSNTRILLSTGAGVDLPMIDAVKRAGIPATLVIPFPNHTERWPDHLTDKFNELAEGMNRVTLADSYMYGVYDARNVFIARHADNPLWVFWTGAGDDGFGRLLGLVSQPGLTHTVWNMAGDWSER